MHPSESPGTKDFLDDFEEHISLKESKPWGQLPCKHSFLAMAGKHKPCPAQLFPWASVYHSHCWKHSSASKAFLKALLLWKIQQFRKRRTSLWVSLSSFHKIKTLWAHFLRHLLLHVNDATFSPAFTPRCGYTQPQPPAVPQVPHISCSKMQ